MATTQLLLLEDVAALGRSGDVVTVKKGYARNFLVPNGKAFAATTQALRKQKALQEERGKKAAVDRKESEKQAKALEGKVVTVEVKVDPEGHMYGSVSVVDIARFINEQLGFEIDKRTILSKQHIKRTGEHAIELRLAEDVPAVIMLVIRAEGAAEAEEGDKKKKKEESSEAEVAEAEEQQQE